MVCVYTLYGVYFYNKKKKCTTSSFILRSGSIWSLYVFMKAEWLFVHYVEIVKH